MAGGIVVVEAREVEETMKENQGMLENSNLSLLNEDSYRIEGVCMECDKADSDEMIQCQSKNCNAWTHYSCDSLDKESVSKFHTYYCIRCRRDHGRKNTFKRMSIPAPKTLRVSNVMEVKNLLSDLF